MKENDIGIKIINSEVGRKIFHLKVISISYRNRGKVPRIQINIVVNNSIIIINVGELMFLKKY